jgi:hypothetical protein
MRRIAARNSRPKRIGSATKLRNGAMLFSIDGPIRHARRDLGPTAALNSSQKRSVAPLVDMIFERTLHVTADARRRAHAASAKPRSEVT